MITYTQGPVLAWLSRIIGLPGYRQKPPRQQTPQQLRAWLGQVAPLAHAARARGQAINVWDVAGLKHDELRNVAVLAWLLDPRGTHGYGPAVLAAVMGLLRQRAGLPVGIAGDETLCRTAVLTEHWPLASQRDRVDIALDGQDFTLLVEVKIRAPEGPDQLARYARSAQARRRAMGHDWAGVLYLSPRPPVCLPPQVTHIDWHDVSAILRRLPATGFNGMLTQQFASHIDNF